VPALDILALALALAGGNHIVYTHRLGESMEPEPFTLPSGEEITVRGLTGMEVALIAKRNAQLADDPDAPGGTAIQIGFAVLGKTDVRAAEAAGVKWLNGHNAADFTTVGDQIERLSGYGKGAQKSVVDQATDD
jgi:hypothetical protein